MFVHLQHGGEMKGFCWKSGFFTEENFPRLRRAERGFAFGTVLVSPKSATLTVTIIPVSPEGGSPSRGSTTFVWYSQLYGVISML